MEALRASTGPPAALANPRPVGRVTPCAPRCNQRSLNFPRCHLPVRLSQWRSPSSPAGTPLSQFAPIPSRFVTPNRIKSNFFAPVHFHHAPGHLDARPPTYRARRECRASGLAEDAPLGIHKTRQTRSLNRLPISSAARHHQSPITNS